MKKEKKLSPLTVGATYIGTVVGAGFASGQEVLLFFGYFGPIAYIGLGLSTLLFMFFGWQMLLYGYKLKAESHLPVVKYFTGRIIGTLIDIVITFFLFGALTLMAAGAGSLFKEQFGLAPFFGSITVIAATFVTVALGVSSVIRSISLVVPLLLTAVTYVSVRVIIDSNLIGISAVNALPGNAVVGNWLLAATLYVSYNLILAVAVLAPLGREANDRHSINAGALLGGLGLGLGAIVIATALLLTRSTAAQFEVPMIFLAGTISPLVQTIYSGVLFAEVYTTAVGGLYGFVARLAGSGKKRLWFTAGASLGALVLSGIGFVNLIRYLLPAVGYIGLLLLTGIVYQFVRERSVNLSPIPAVKPQDNRDKRDR